MNINRIDKSYINISGNIYHSEYINLANVKDGSIKFDSNTLFLDEEDKAKLNSQSIESNDNCIYIFNYNGVWGIICDLPIKEYEDKNVRCHELVIPETIQGMLSNLHSYNCETAPSLLGHTGNIDYEKYINDKLYEKKYSFENIELFVVKGEYAEDIINNFKDVDYLYVADGHHRLYSTYLSKFKKSSLVCLISFNHLNILPIHRLIRGLSKEEIQKGISFIKDKFKIKEENNELLKGDIKITTNNETFITELVELNSDMFWNNDIYRLNTQIISQAFRIFDNSKITYLLPNEVEEARENIKDTDILIETYPTSNEEFLHYANNEYIMPPKSTCFLPKFPSFLVFKEYQ